MSIAVWTVLALMGMVTLFVACVIAVVVGVRVLENIVAKHSRRPSA